MEKSDWDYETEIERLEKEYGIPSFEDLAEDFDVEKVLERETNFLAREIRRIIVEKFSAYAHLFETLINPSAPPMFIFSILRKISKDDKEKIKDIYKKISRLQIKVMKLDTIYSEKEEAEYIKLTFKEWQTMKKTIYEIIEGFDEGFENDSNNNERGYFG